LHVQIILTGIRTCEWNLITIFFTILC